MQKALFLLLIKKAACASVAGMLPETPLPVGSVQRARTGSTGNRLEMSLQGTRSKWLRSRAGGAAASGAPGSAQSFSPAAVTAMVMSVGRPVGSRPRNRFCVIQYLCCSADLRIKAN